ncbi:Mbeg1-like protein [Bacillus sp. REN3]|uniref:Mbeg1-like protein n=1 Tax=Bacillus sp. REN3 TaxID=2802440 RepID=UPI001AEEFD80|nr:Mbeg1-like protein [Bacillus sp. REN3]
MLLSNPSSKYYNWKIADYTNKNESSGFVAYTIEPTDKEAVIVMRGSEPFDQPEHLNTDWDNNFHTLHEVPTIQQADAMEYYNRIGKKYDVISSAGHSLGGNVALSGAFLADPEIREKIWAIRTFNAPGFNKEFLNKHEEPINELAGRIYEFQNEDDVVSSLMYNPTKPIIIETNMKTSEGIFRLSDPIKYLLDSHALRHMAVKEDGTLRRKDYQLKNFTNHFVSNLTKSFQILPNPVLGGFVETTFALINGRVNLEGLMKGALLLTMIAPAAVLAAGVVTVKAIAIAAAAILVVTMAVTLREYTMMAIEQFTQKIYAQINAFMDNLFEKMVLSARAAATKLAEFKNMVNEQVTIFLAKTTAGFVKWLKSVTGGAREMIQVNTGHLRAIAERLSSIQHKINRVDSRLDSLRKMAELDDKLSIAFIDFRMGNDYELRNVINYLNFTASKLDDAERKLSYQARGIR